MDYKDRWETRQGQLFGRFAELFAVGATPDEVLSISDAYFKFCSSIGHLPGIVLFHNFRLDKCIQALTKADLGAASGGYR